MSWINNPPPGPSRAFVPPPPPQTPTTRHLSKLTRWVLKAVAVALAAQVAWGIFLLFK